MFDWLALGDDDTTFMYHRAKDFLRHIDHTKVRFPTLTSAPVRVTTTPPQHLRDTRNVTIARGQYHCAHRAWQMDTDRKYRAHTAAALLRVEYALYVVRGDVAVYFMYNM